jgi:hypothetical protein
MNGFLIALTGALLLVSGHPMAQPMYRCGNAYSQTPCAPDAQPARISPGAPPDQPAGLQGAELCAAELPRLIGMTDPYTARIESVAKGDSEVIHYAGQPIAARKYLLSINARNAAGAYAGERPYLCYLSEDERRILKVSAARR